MFPTVSRISDCNSFTNLVAVVGFVGIKSATVLAYQNEAIGELRVAPRTGESLSSADQNLVKDLARQIGIAIHAAR